MKFLHVGIIASAGASLVDPANAQFRHKNAHAIKTRRHLRTSSDAGPVFAEQPNFGAELGSVSMSMMGGAANAMGHSAKASKASSKSSKATDVPTPSPTPVDWCPDSPLTRISEMRAVSAAHRKGNNPSKKPTQLHKASFSDSLNLPEVIASSEGPTIDESNKPFKKSTQLHKAGFSDSVNLPDVITSSEGPKIDEIVGGMDVDSARKYPFFVYFENGCSGTLIASNLVLSAAHCEGELNVATLGLHQIDVNSAEEFANIEHIPVKQYNPHPCYDRNTGDEYDFMVVELEWSTEIYKDNIIELDSPYDDLNLDDGKHHNLTTIGFGDVVIGTNFVPNTLQEVTIDYMPSCGNYFPGRITDSMLCAGNPEGGKDTCNGDSGGPIIDSDTQKQVGITSWGAGCALPGFPGVYARVSVGYDWINSYITELGNDVPAPAPDGVCVDEPEGWFNTIDEKWRTNTCLWYAEDASRCSEFGDSYDNGGKTANKACCACAPLDFPSEVSGYGENGTTSFEVELGYTSSYEAAAHGLVEATVTSGTVAQGDSQFHTFDLAGAAFFRVSMPPGSVANPNIDLEIYLYDPEENLVDYSENPFTDEVVEVTLPVDGIWTLEVYGWDTVGPSADYDFYSWIISLNPGGNMEVLNAPGIDATLTSGTVAQKEFQRHTFNLTEAAFFRVSMPPGSVANPDIDLDIYLYDPEDNLVDYSENPFTDEVVEVTEPMDGIWTLKVYGYNTVGPSADYDFYSWIIPLGSGGNMEVLNAPFMRGVTVEWIGAANDVWNLGAVSHTGKGTLRGLTLVEVDNRPKNGLTYPKEIDGTGEDGATSFDVFFGYDGSYAAQAHGLVPATNNLGEVVSLDYDVHTFELSGAAVFRAALTADYVSPDDTDFDLYLVDPLNQPVDDSAYDGNDEVVQVTLPMDGEWKVYVYRYDNDGLGALASYEMFSWIVSAIPGGDLNVTSSSNSAVDGQSAEIDISWPVEDAWRVGAVSHSNGTDLLGVTVVNSPGSLTPSPTQATSSPGIAPSPIPTYSSPIPTFSPTT